MNVDSVDLIPDTSPSRIVAVGSAPDEAPLGASGRRGRADQSYGFAKYRVLGAILALKSFTVDELARFSGCHPGSVRTILARNRDQVEEQSTESTGKRGGQLIRYRLRPEHEEALEEFLKGFFPEARNYKLPNPPTENAEGQASHKSLDWMNRDRSFQDDPSSSISDTDGFEQALDNSTPFTESPSGLLVADQQLGSLWDSEKSDKKRRDLLLEARDSLRSAKHELQTWPLRDRESDIGKTVFNSFTKVSDLLKQRTQEIRMSAEPAILSHLTIRNEGSKQTPFEICSVDSPWGKWDDSDSSTRNSGIESRVSLMLDSMLFDGISISECTQIAKVASRRTLEYHQLLFVQGQPVRQVFVLESGSVKLTQLSSNGNEVILWFKGETEVVSPQLPGLDRVHTCSARATESSTALVWEANTFELFTSEISQIRANIGRILSGNLLELEERFREIATEKVAKRVALAILRAVGKVGKHSANGVQISLSREELAQLTGTTLFTISRLISKWSELGFVLPSKRSLLVIDQRGLGQIGVEIE